MRPRKPRYVAVLRYPHDGSEVEFELSEREFFDLSQKWLRRSRRQWKRSSNLRPPPRVGRPEGESEVDMSMEKRDVLLIQTIRDAACLVAAAVLSKREGSLSDPHLCARATEISKAARRMDLGIYLFPKEAEGNFSEP